MKAEIKLHLFQEAISRVCSFASTDKARPALNAVFVKNLGMGLCEFAAADGFRSAYSIMPYENFDGEIGAIGSIDISEIDRPAKEMGRIFAMKRQGVMSNMEKDSQSFDRKAIGGGLWSLKAKYPEKKMVSIPLPNLHMDLEPFFQSVVAMKYTRVRIAIADNVVALSCDDESKKYVQSISFEHTGDKSLHTEWLVNLKMFRSIIRAANGMQMELFVPDGTEEKKLYEHRPLFFREISRETVSFILMPMHDGSRKNKG